MARNNNNRSNSRNDSYDAKNYVKKSGSKAGRDKNGNEYTNGWRVSRRFGMTSYFASAYKDSTITQSKTGKSWLTVIVKVTPENAAPFITTGLRDQQTGKVVVKSLGLVMNPNGGKGGFCGRIGTK